MDEGIIMEFTGGWAAYCIVAILWGFYAALKQTNRKDGEQWKMFASLFLNLLFCPIGLWIALNKEIEKTKRA